MLERTIMAGFGGQGLMFMGKLTAKMMMDEGLYVTYFPSYGAEVRGGTAHCHVIVSSDEIPSPVASEVDTLITMNQPSYEKFRSHASPEGVILVNSSLATATDPPPVATLLDIPATQMAADLGSVRVANMIMMGAYNAVRNLLPFDKLTEQMKNAFGQNKAAIFDINIKAIEAGRDFVSELVSA